jgi:hypothetical protein
MKRYDGPGLFAGCHHGIPVTRVDRRKPELVWSLGEGHRLESAFGIPADFLRADLDVQKIGQLHRDDAPGVGSSPLLDTPVIPGPNGGEREFRVFGCELQPLPGEARQEGGKIHRGPHAGDVHVLHAVVDVPCASSHLIESRRFEAVLRYRPAHHGVETHVGHHLPRVVPGLAPVLRLDHTRCLISEGGGKATFEGVTRLHDVIIH